MEKIKKYITSNQQRFLNELFDFLRIPSVSPDPKHRKDIDRAASFVSDRLLEAGVDSAAIVQTDKHPIVTAEKIAGPDKPTVLVYGHYDVQPVDPIEKWNCPPFEPHLQDGKIYGRGASDDKGQLYMHIKAIEYFKSQNEYPCNVKFVIEGEEEIGSVSLGKYLTEQKEKLQADAVLVSDTAMLPGNKPAITVGLRGLSAVEIEVKGPNRDLHSGIYGGSVGNPINVLCKMISALQDEKNRITVPGIYDEVEELTREERKIVNQAGLDKRGFQNELAIQDTQCEDGYTHIECTTIRPSLDINGIAGGYAEEGFKTVLPAKSIAKLSIRLVPNQKAEKITNEITDFLKQLAPSTVSVSVRQKHGAEPVLIPTNFVAYQAASDALEKVFGVRPLPIRSGGSIPVIALFEEVLGLKTILLGFGQDSDAIHSPNEHFAVDNFLKGIETIIHFYENFSLKST